MLTYGPNNIPAHLSVSQKISQHGLPANLTVHPPANLVAKDPDGSGGGDLVGAEPDGGQTGRQADDEDLGRAAQGLRRHQQWKPCRRHGCALQPGSQGVDGASGYVVHTKTAAVQNVHT